MSLEELNALLNEVLEHEDYQGHCHQDEIKSREGQIVCILPGYPKALSN